MDIWTLPRIWSQHFHIHTIQINSDCFRCILQLGQTSFLFPSTASTLTRILKKRIFLFLACKTFFQTILDFLFQSSQLLGTSKGRVSAILLKFHILPTQEFANSRVFRWAWILREWFQNWPPSNSFKWSWMTPLNVFFRNHRFFGSRTMSASNNPSRKEDSTSPATLSGRAGKCISWQNQQLEII